MKRAIILLLLSISLASIFCSCTKEPSFNGNQPPGSAEEDQAAGRGKPRPPVANAGPDQTISLPVNTVILDGRYSTDPDNNIASYLWRKISGPSSFTIANPNAARTQVNNLVEGTYLFELKVTDTKRLFDYDTVQVTVNPLGPPPPPCTSNCGKIVFVSDRDGNNEIYSCNADGSNITRLTNDPDEDGDPAWSPDGTRIAFIKSNSTGTNLFTMNADGSNVVQLTFLLYVRHPAWSPDGSRIAFDDFYEEIDGEPYYFPHIKVVDLASAVVSPIPNTYSQGYPSASWSPNGTKIAFSSDMTMWDFVWDIYTVSPDGNGLTNLTPQFYGDYDYFDPSWSPDGTKLSVMLGPVANNQTGIAVMNADGTGLAIIRIGLPPYNSFGKTSWSPDGTRIAFTEDNSVKWVAANGSIVGTIVTNGWDADWSH